MRRILAGALAFCAALLMPRAEAQTLCGPYPTTYGQVLTFGGASVGNQWCMPPSATSGTTFPIRVITGSASSDTALGTDFAIVWNKSAGSPSSELLPACSAGNGGKVYIVKDGRGDAATNNVTLTPQSGTIDGAANYVINENHAAAMVQCDGISNWTVL